MIVIESKKIVIITPPHTASGNLNKALCTQAGGQLVLGPNPEVDVDHHNVRIHPAWKWCRIAVVVRDPLTRLVGLWLHYEWALKQRRILSTNPISSWTEFVKAVAADESIRLPWLFRWTITRLIEPLRFTGLTYLHYETLINDLTKLLECQITLDAQYHDSIKLEEWYADRDILKMATAWAQPDKIRFNY